MSRIITMTDARKKAAQLAARLMSARGSAIMESLGESDELADFTKQEESLERVAIGFRWVQEKLLDIAGESDEWMKLPANFFWNKGLTRMVRRTRR